MLPNRMWTQKYSFTGKSSRTLQDILLTIDNAVQTDEKFKEAELKVLQCLNDLKTELDDKITPTTTFECILVGSVAERYGIPYAYMKSSIFAFISALKTDFDVMFCFQSLEASFDGKKDLFIEPEIPKDIGFLGFVQLKSMATQSVISSNDVLKQAQCAVGRMKTANLALVGCCPDVDMNIKPPAIKIFVPKQYEADIALCIKCSEWPPLSDWPTRQRCWPSPEDVRRIVSLGCHFVPKPAPSDLKIISWRFSFSLAEVELSKLVPKTARKCFLALRIILKEHLQPVSKISSYHIKTMFLNTLERTPTNLWVDENIEKCFFILLKELYDALRNGRLLHHWFCKVNLFDGFDRPRAAQALIKKLQRIGENPAPFIFDDGCWCLWPCCTRLRLYDFPEQVRTDIYDEAVQVVHVNEQVELKIEATRMLLLQQ